MSNGHQVVIERNAGEAAHFRDKDYSEAGARIAYTIKVKYTAPVLVKVRAGGEEDPPYPHLFLQVIISPIHLSQ